MQQHFSKEVESATAVPPSLHFLLLDDMDLFGGLSRVLLRSPLVRACRRRFVHLDGHLGLDTSDTTRALRTLHRRAPITRPKFFQQLRQFQVPKPPECTC